VILACHASWSGEQRLGGIQTAERIIDDVRRNHGHDSIFRAESNRLYSKHLCVAGQ
jgi:hypothetical protein